MVLDFCVNFSILLAWAAFSCSTDFWTILDVDCEFSLSFYLY